MFISGHFHVLGMRKPHFQCNANREVATAFLVFSTNRIYCTFVLWRLYLAPSSHAGQSTTLLRLERQSSKCVSLHTVAQARIRIPRRVDFISVCSRHTGFVHHASEMSADQDWIGLDQDWSQFCRIRTGSDCNFFQNCRIRTGSD